MKVYDVVQTVTAEGAKNSSYPIGSWIVNVWINDGAAAVDAERANENCHVDGVRYSVECHDELSPLRKMDRGDYFRMMRGEKVSGYSDTAIKRSRESAA